MSKNNELEHCVFGDIIYEVGKNPCKKSYSYSFFQQLGGLKHYNQQFLIKLTDILKKDIKHEGGKIYNAQISPAKFYYMLRRELNDSLIKRIANNRTDDRTESSTDIGQDKEDIISNYKKLRIKFLMDMLRGYKTYYDAITCENLYSKRYYARV